MDLGIEGKVAVVAASSRGIGFACAEQLARNGAVVSLCSRDLRRAKDAGRRIEDATGSKVRAFSVDLGNPRDVEAWFSATEAELGPPSILVANGPGPSLGTFEQLGDEDWLRACDQVLVSMARMIRHALQAMVAQRWGRIVIINSYTARQPLANLTLSNAVRAGLQGLAKSVADEVGHANVTVNTVLPGATATERLRELIRANAERSGTSEEEASASFSSEAAIARLVSPNEVASAVAFLCSDVAGAITGTSLTVDGGATRAT